MVQLFNVEQYELPTFDEVDWFKTKYQLGIFLSAYRTSRERMGYSPTPKLSQEALLLEDSVAFRREGLLKSDYQIRYENMHANFLTGLSAIMHPYRPDITIRRRKIFFYRYLYGLSVPLVSERVAYQKNIIIDESKMATIQFTEALDLLALK